MIPHGRKPRWRKSRPRVLAAIGAILAPGAIVTVLESLGSSAASDERQADAARRSLVWADEFRGPAGARPDRRKWGFETGHGWGDEELQGYTDRRANASLDGKGRLRITARRERFRHPDGFTSRYTSARLTTQHKLELAYGRIEARVRVPAARGLLPAFWALGNNLDSAGWPASGEIDVMEVNGAKPRLVSGNLHGPRRGHKDFSLGGNRRTARPLSKGFHVYGVRWSPNRIAFTLDGEVYAVRTRAHLPRGARWPFNRPFFLLFTLPVGGTWLGPPDATTPWPATMLVDWVRVRPHGLGTFCARVRAREFRKRCPRHPTRRRGRSRGLRAVPWSR
jgi:beta-glucanase (GH16 family)